MFQIAKRLTSHLETSKYFYDHLKLIKKCYCTTISQTINDEKLQEPNVDNKNLTLPKIKKVPKVDGLRLNDKNIAKKFVDLIRNDLTNDPSSFYAELNPGLGYLTNELLNSDIPVLHLYEKITDYNENLQKINDEHNDRLDIRNYDFLKLAKTEFIDDVTNSKKLSNLLDGIPVKEWTSDPAIKIIGAVPNMSFLYYLQYSLIDKCLSKFGRIVLNVAILPSMSLAFQDVPENTVFHRAKNIFLRNMFDYKYLDSVPRKSFYPEQFKKLKQRNSKYYAQDDELMDIVRIESKRTFFHDNFDSTDAKMFLYFLKIQMKRKDTRIIPSLEKWISGCGPRLIRKNMTIFTTYSELNSTELLDLFNEFKSWPEYKSCQFYEIVNSMIESQSRFRKR